MQHAGIRFVKTRARIPSNTTASNSEASIPNSSTINFTSSYKFKIVPELVISDIRPGSPADQVGLEIGDTVLSINHKNLNSLTLQKAIAEFYGRDGKRIRMTIERQGGVMKYQFELRNLLHKKRESEK